MQRPTHLGTDLVVAALVAAAAGLLFIGASTLPPPRWEPLGPAAVPRALGTLLGLFAAILAAGALRALLRGADTPAFAPERARMLRGCGILAALIGFVVAMDAANVPFLVAGPVFVVAIAALVGGLSMRGLMWSAVWGVALCAGVFFAFTRFFFINLP
jgi:putative tricarboxylic transport membrane protein